MLKVTIIYTNLTIALIDSLKSYKTTRLFSFLRFCILDFSSLTMSNLSLNLQYLSRHPTERSLRASPRGSQIPLPSLTQQGEAIRLATAIIQDAAFELLCLMDAKVLLGEMFLVERPVNAETLVSIA